MTSKRIANVVVASIVFGATKLASAQQPAAPTEKELAAARQLFQEAYKDEQDGRCEDAGRKFREVAKTKESASVRYRIAKTQVCLGHLMDARDKFRALAGAKAMLDPKDQPIADSAAAEVIEIEKRLSHLTVKFPTPVPEGTRVTVDGAPVPSDGTAKPMELDPGEHVVRGRATGMKPFEKTIKIAASTSDTYTVQFESVSGAPVAGTPPPPTPSEGGRGRGVLPYILLGGGGLLMLGGGAFFLVREGTIDDIKSTCPNNVCPTSTQSDIEDKRDQADLFMPLGIGFVAAGAIAAAAGVYFLVRPQKSAEAPRTGLVHLGPRPVSGGMMMGAGGTF